MKVVWRGLILLILGCTTVSAATVRTAALGTLLQPLRFSAPAEVVQPEHSLLSARINSQVEQVHVRVGDQVEAGALLVSLDCRDHRLQLRQQQAGREGLVAQQTLARQQLQRANKLLKQRNASRELYDQRRAELTRLLAELDASSARLAEAELAVERCDVRAPFAGLITERLASTGSYMAIGSGLVRLLRLDGLEVSAELSTTDVAALQQATMIRLDVDNKSYPLQLRTVLPRVDKRARTRTARLTFSDTPALAGSSGRLHWQDGRQQLAARYRVRHNGSAGLMLWTAGKVRFYPLPEAIEGQPVVVDLPAETLIIVEGQFAVTDGDSVEQQELTP